MRMKHIRRAAILLLSLLMIMSMTACGGKSDKKDSDSKESSSQAKQDNPEYVKDDVVLPEDFGNMIYPVESVMVEDYGKGLPYYTEDSDEDEADSFWFTMAVLTSQMNHYVKDVAVDKKDGYLFIDEATMNMYASGLYDAFGKGDMEFPDLGDDAYAIYDDNKEIYGFREGTIGNLAPYITECEEGGNGYRLTAHLKDKDKDKILASYEIKISKSSFEDEDNILNYSVKDIEKIETQNMKDFTEKKKGKKKDKSKEEDTEESEEKSDEESYGESNTESEEGAGRVSADDAREIALDYYSENYGDEEDLTFEDTITIGDDEYYDFIVGGDDPAVTDILVSVDGEMVLGGRKNDDDSWSFDQ